MNQSINTDSKNSKEPQQKYRLGTVSIKILGGLNRFYRFLNEMASPVAPALTHIYQASYEQGQVSDNWKRVFVTLLFKTGDKSKASNYRPDLLTSCCCKVMEHIVHSHLMKFLENKKILSDYQHSFRKKRSCETQLITTVHDLAIGLDRRQQVDAI